MIELSSSNARAVVDPAAGARLASLVIHGRERLVTGPGHPMMWGCYPMVPFAGRIGHGRFTFEGREHQLILNLPPHAIHGTGFESAWEVEGEWLVHRFDERWPFAGSARQRVLLGDGSLRCELEVAAGERQPVTVGWHPWFAGPPSLAMAAAGMYERDGEHLPTGRIVAPTPPPWDDCFCEVTQPLRLTWDDGLVVALTSSCDHWVVYDPPGAICVEPQSGPPDQVRLHPAVAEPGAVVRHWMQLTWDHDAAGVITGR